MTKPLQGSVHRRADGRTLTLPVALILHLAFGHLAWAQTVSTVREDEFRSRWADYQVDLPQTTGSTAANVGSPTGLLGVFGKPLDQIFSGPFQFRANFATGFEYSDEVNLRPTEKNRSNDSAYASPSIGLFYNREFGPLTLSTRYSAGYTYYFDDHYVGSSDSGGIFSQTAGIDLDLLGTRNTFHSTTSSSFGNGDDIESGQQRDRFAIGEALAYTYQLTDETALGGSGSFDYTTYSGGTVSSTDTLSDTGRIYADYSITGKTRLRLEVSAGQEKQRGSDRSYLQTLLAVNWVPTPKLTVDVGVGVGDQSNNQIQGRGEDGLRPVYTFTINYIATEKTSGLFHVGFQGVDVEPDLSLVIQYQPRLTTTIHLSAYQSSNFSTYLEAQSLVTRGILASAEQRLFSRVDVSVSGGVEQSEGYSSLARSVRASAYDKPYYFGNLSLLWQINSWLAFQTYYRGYTGRPGVVSNANEGLQSRASVSLRITF